MTSASPWPTLVPWPMAQTLIFQAVRFSGMVSETSAMPFLSVVSDADPEGGVGEVLADGRLRPSGGSAPPPHGPAVRARLAARRRCPSSAGRRRHGGHAAAIRRCRSRRPSTPSCGTAAPPNCRRRMPARSSPPACSSFVRNSSTTVAAEDAEVAHADFAFGAADCRTSEPGSIRCADSGAGATSRRTP